MIYLRIHGSFWGCLVLGSFQDSMFVDSFWGQSQAVPPICARGCFPGAQDAECRRSGGGFGGMEVMYHLSGTQRLTSLHRR